MTVLLISPSAVVPALARAHMVEGIPSAAKVPAATRLLLVLPRTGPAGNGDYGPRRGWPRIGTEGNDAVTGYPERDVLLGLEGDAAAANYAFCVPGFNTINQELEIFDET